VAQALMLVSELVLGLDSWLARQMVHLSKQLVVEQGLMLANELVLVLDSLLARRLVFWYFGLVEELG
jgi:Na+-transporting NADH:ubiquinone oxidoreductase subunit NqrD